MMDVTTVLKNQPAQSHCALVPAALPAARTAATTRAGAGKRAKHLLTRLRDMASRLSGS